MYAVIETGGKQYRVEVGSELAIERLDVEPGQAFEFERVLLVADDGATVVGRPLVEGAHVTASIVRQDRADKIVVFKYKPKARSRVKRGHRQEQTVIRVSDIVHGDRSAAALLDAARAAQRQSEVEAAEAAAKRAESDRAIADQLASSRAGTAAPAETPKRAGVGARVRAQRPDRPTGSTPGGRTQAPEAPARPKAPRPARAPKKDQ
jgi:large subunit ribosomal protein L21